MTTLRSFAYAAATRSPPCRVRVVMQGFECPHFTCLFHGWDSLGGAKVSRRSTSGSKGQAFVDPRNTYIARRKSKRQNVILARTINQERQHASNSPSSSRKRTNSGAQNSIFAALLGALSAPTMSLKHNHPHIHYHCSKEGNAHGTNNHVEDTEIQLGRVLDSPDPRDTDSEDDDILASSEDILYRANRELAAATTRTGVNDATVDPIIRGAEDARDATRRRRKSCSF